MSRAISPKDVPNLPKGMIAWARSTKRAGGMFHAHALGFSACKSIVLERYQSTEADSLGDFQYWGCCPRCLALAKKSEAA
jgi:hypothetical protein